MDESPRLVELRRRVREDPASVAFAALAEELRRAGRCPEAIEVAEAGLARHPGYTSARVTLGRALFESGSIGDARRELEEALASAPENLAGLRALAEIYRTIGLPGRALDLARRGTALAPQDREWRHLLEALEPTVDTRRAAPPSVAAQQPTGPARPAIVSPALRKLEAWLDAILQAKAQRHLTA
jgi:predicted Zn-dependent protease